MNVMRYRKLTSRTVFIAIAGIVLAGHARAADAVFSNDGQHVYTVNDDKMVLDDVDLNKRRVVEIPLTPPSGSTTFVDLSRANDGRLLLASKIEVWALDVAAAAWTKLCVAPAGVEFKRVAFDPKTRGCLLLTRNKEPRLLWLSPDTQEVERVETPLHDVDWYMIFDQSGHLLFDFRGDLWRGTIQRSNESFHPGELVLVASRLIALAPLASANYFFENPHVGQIAPSTKGIYAMITGLSSGTENWAALIKFPPLRFQPTESHTFDTEMKVQDRLSICSQLFGSARVIYPHDAVSLCSSPTGDRVYFESGRDRYLVTNGKIENLNIR